MRPNRELIVIRRLYLVRRQAELGLTNFETADLLEITPRYYAKILDGVRGKHMSAILMMKICEVFGFSEKDLLRLESDFQKQLMNMKNTT